MRLASWIAAPLLGVLLSGTSIPAIAACPGQPCVTVRFEGRDFETVYVRKEHKGAPADIFYYPIIRDGQRIHRDGQPLWGHFARWPAADHPDQSAAQTWHVYATLREGRWVDHEDTGVRFEPTSDPQAAAEAAGRALFAEALRQRQALDAAAPQAPGATPPDEAENKAPAKTLAFDVGEKESLPPADTRRVYIAQRYCGYERHPDYASDVARNFPGNQNYALADPSLVKEVLSEDRVPTIIPYWLGKPPAFVYGPFPHDQAIRTLDRWNREGNCWKPPNLTPVRSQSVRPPLPPSMRSDEPYGQGR